MLTSHTSVLSTSSKSPIGNLVEIAREDDFIEPLVKELPMEYAVEMNRLIQLQMEGSIG